MTLRAPFVYLRKADRRKHGPAGYENYQDYKPWLRDEFSFRCVYCLEREMWHPDRANSFSADHVVPQKDDPSRVSDYTNLVYACLRCNSFKSGVLLLDPAQTPLGKHLTVEDDGFVRALSNEGEFLIRQLHLNVNPAREVRQYYLELLALKKEFPDDPRVQSLYFRSFCFPDDLPNLVPLKPPGGNSLEMNKYDSFHARREQGSLEQVYLLSRRRSHRET